MLRSRFVHLTWAVGVPAFADVHTVLKLGPLGRRTGLRTQSADFSLNLCCLLLSTLRFPPSHPVQMLNGNSAHTLFFQVLSQDYSNCSHSPSASPCPFLGIMTTTTCKERLMKTEVRLKLARFKTKLFFFFWGVHSRSWWISSIFICDWQEETFNAFLFLPKYLFRCYLSASVEQGEPWVQFNQLQQVQPMLVSGLPEKEMSADASQPFSTAHQASRANLYTHVWESAKLTLLHAEINFVFSAVFNFVL